MRPEATELTLHGFWSLFFFCHDLGDESVVVRAIQAWEGWARFDVSSREQNGSNFLQKRVQS
ncbi:MAG: hypothetical protein AMXMBFR84_33530 [Candidatus Hydrogenedentota bacterium]